ncbi:MAG TPA: phage holin family protein [Jatrophihabitans sp.]|nr:phage holin family protein [Jatrophihabitans sp.]
MTASTGPKPTPSPQPPALDKPDGKGKHAAEPSVGQLAADVSAHLSTLVRSEIELAKLELRATVKNAGVGAGLFIAALVVLVFSLTFLFFFCAFGLAALGLDLWLGFLIVFGAQFVVVLLLALLGWRKVRKVRGPQKTIETTKETVDYLKKSRA